MNFSSGEFILIRKSFKKCRIKFIFVVIVFISIILFLDFQFRPMIKSVAISKSRTVFSEVINEAVLEDINNNPENYKEVVNINKNEVGEVLAVSSDIEKINSLKSNINLLVQKKLCNLNQKNIYIPFGTLLGIEILNGKGPPIPLTLSVSGSIFTDLVSNFLNSGINQTLHQIYLCVKTKISVMLPGCSCVSEFETKILIAETIIVGKVPNYCNNSISPTISGNTSK